MSKIKNAIETIQDCPDCYGKGMFGWANDEDYDFEYCDCNPYRLILDYDGDLVYEGEFANA